MSRQKDKKTNSQKAKIQKNKKERKTKVKDQKESLILWRQGSFALLRCFHLKTTRERNVTSPSSACLNKQKPSSWKIPLLLLFSLLSMIIWPGMLARSWRRSVSRRGKGRRWWSRRSRSCRRSTQDSSSTSPTPLKWRTPSASVIFNFQVSSTPNSLIRFSNLDFWDELRPLHWCFLIFNF